MKGKIVLLLLKEPKEGMKVVYDSTKVVELMAIRPQKEEFSDIVDEEGKMFYCPHIKLQQIAVEYEDVITYGGYNQRVKAKTTLPLHPDDYEKALPLIGKEVEFKIYPQGDVQDFAGLITPTPVMYTEEEVEEICRKCYTSTFKAVAYLKVIEFDD